MGNAALVLPIQEAISAEILMSSRVKVVTPFLRYLPAIVQTVSQINNMANLSLTFAEKLESGREFLHRTGMPNPTCSVALVLMGVTVIPIDKSLCYAVV
jgi:hypothetical protein